MQPRLGPQYVAKDDFGLLILPSPLLSAGIVTGMCHKVQFVI